MRSKSSSSSTVLGFGREAVVTAGWGGGCEGLLLYECVREEGVVLETCGAAEEAVLDEVERPCPDEADGAGGDGDEVCAVREEDLLADEDVRGVLATAL